MWACQSMANNAHHVSLISARGSARHINDKKARERQAKTIHRNIVNKESENGSISFKVDEILNIHVCLMHLQMKFIISTLQIAAHKRYHVI